MADILFGAQSVVQVSEVDASGQGREPSYDRYTEVVRDPDTGGIIREDE
ncbi:MAG: hypothetical protein AVDCRST_MAG37-593 [uncultured Rubrobacteraceae bacterium]|uniref:Uncharacterized protein n=1 Tax=uncultured Rubrobacteraceae bacterium TaxID=349277 RepID=A0A6J4Q0N5_9ACTN|nr:MAG: hypothetical protein AVDCRST_MAG37-593 [uncultured Rubrobacteraceae bacterium]